MTVDHKEARALVDPLRNGQQCDEDGVMCIISRQLCHEAADAIAAALAENERLREALTQIERTYYTEGKADKWRAVKMNEIAYAAQNGGTDQ